ncbi:MAG: response regulator [Candidatus Eiseniibacteriota bacterium]
MRPDSAKFFILVVEDDDSCRDMVTGLLSSAGYKVIGAKDFFKAIEVVEGPAPIDLLLADVVMPPGTPHGIALGRMAQLKRGQLKVMFMSSGIDPAEIDLLKDDDRFIRKPFSPRELIEAVDHAVAPLAA